MIDRATVDKIMDATNIVDVVSDFVTLRKAGVNYKGLCPFHDDSHPSLSFKVSKNTFRCFVCGASGGPIDLVMKYLNKDFKEACRWLQTLPFAPP